MAFRRAGYITQMNEYIFYYLEQFLYSMKDSRNTKEERNVFNRDQKLTKWHLGGDT